MTAVTLTVNGQPVNADVDPRTHLADFLREKQMLTGTHLGCEHGVCGACTLLVDGVPVRSCITYAVACSGASVTTIEALDDDEIGIELRAAFSREHALQCGYCTPGMLMSARDLVLRAPDGDERRVRVAMSGNLCRCTGYAGIVRAVMSVIADRRARGIGPVAGAGRTALGPAGSGHRTTKVAASAARGRSDEPASAAAADDQLTAWEPQTSFQQSFTIQHPLADTWAFFGDPAKVAACIPGASVSGDVSGRKVAGKIRIKVGPITADFHGTALIDRDPASYSGTLEGSGRDARGASTTRGRIDYCLRPNGERATEIELDVGYRLTGPLAQFSRSDIVQNIANRLVGTFAQNVDAQLSGKRDTGDAAAEFDAGGLFVSVIFGRIKTLLGRIFGKTTPHHSDDPVAKRQNR
jgi:carbon-monoxide dehydrogenase small subunit